MRGTFAIYFSSQIFLPSEGGEEREVGGRGGGRRKAQRFGKRVAAAYAVKSVYSVSEAGVDTPPQ